NVGTPLSALTPAPVSTKTRSPRLIKSGPNSFPGAIFGIGTIGRSMVALRAPACKDHGMQLTRELSRKVYVQSRLARTIALRYAYLAYSRALLRSSGPPTPEAAASPRARLADLNAADWPDAEAGPDPRGSSYGL